MKATVCGKLLAGLFFEDGRLKPHSVLGITLSRSLSVLSPTVSAQKAAGYPFVGTGTSLRFPIRFSFLNSHAISSPTPVCLVLVPHPGNLDKGQPPCIWAQNGICLGFKSVTFFFFFLASLCSIRYLSFLTRDRTHAPSSGSVSPNHWTAREFPSHFLLKVAPKWTDSLEYRWSR